MLDLVCVKQIWKPSEIVVRAISVVENFDSVPCSWRVTTNNYEPDVVVTLPRGVCWYDKRCHR